jgi:hypothetical protein
VYLNTAGSTPVFFHISKYPDPHESLDFNESVGFRFGATELENEIQEK